jgi:hypothetical protein
MFRLPTARGADREDDFLRCLPACVIALPAFAASSGIEIPSISQGVSRPAFVAPRVVEAQGLNAAIARHRMAKSALLPVERGRARRVCAEAQGAAICGSLPGDLLRATAAIVMRNGPGLTRPEAEAIATYVLGEIAAGGYAHSQLLNATKQMQETQMQFNLHYLGLQDKMADLTELFNRVSRIMKEKHGTAMNAIRNIR